MLLLRSKVYKDNEFIVIVCHHEIKEWSVYDLTLVCVSHLYKKSIFYFEDALVSVAFTVMYWWFQFFKCKVFISESAMCID